MRWKQKMTSLLKLSCQGSQSVDLMAESMPQGGLSETNSEVSPLLPVAVSEVKKTYEARSFSFSCKVVGYR
jgi:hypothetical protein